MALEPWRVDHTLVVAPSSFIIVASAIAASSVITASFAVVGKDPSAAINTFLNSYLF